MEDDLKRLGVGGEDDEVSQASVECLGGLIGSLLQLYHLTRGGQQTYAKCESPHVPSIVSLENR